MCTDFLKKTGRRRRESLTGISGGSKQPRKLFEPLRNVRIIKAKNMQTILYYLPTYFSFSTTKKQQLPTFLLLLLDIYDPTEFT